tara:strand:+ start:38 stop:664 length:627 start_codon:yes stop_codon:yes gene_type:complete
MACNTCGNTTSSPCACQDHGLTTPCSYTNCTKASCEEIYCYDCVVDCTKNINRKSTLVWDAENNDFGPSAIATSRPGLQVEQNDSVKEILQRVALMAMEASQMNQVWITKYAIAPLSIENVGTTTLDLVWDKVPIAATQIQIYQADEATVGGGAFTLINTITTNVSNTFQYSISGLVSGQAYKFKLVTSGGDAGVAVSSVVVYSRTLT